MDASAIPDQPGMRHLFAKIETDGRHSLVMALWTCCSFEGRHLVHRPGDLVAAHVPADRRPPGAGPSVGCILRLRTHCGCNRATEQRLRIYSVNEESPVRAITISQESKVWLYTPPLSPGPRTARRVVIRRPLIGDSVRFGRAA